MPDVGDTWGRLGRFVRDRRAFLGLTQDDLAEVSGVSVQTVRQVEGAKQPTYRDLTLAALERGLGWSQGSIRDVLDGGTPTVTEAPGTGPPPSLPEQPRSDVLTAIDNDPELIGEAKEHLRRQYQLLLRVPEMSDSADKTDRQLRAVAYRRSSRSEQERATDAAREARRAYEAERNGGHDGGERGGR